MLSSATLASLLERTSRTFALAIPLLDEPLEREVGVAYLLYRIADTLEDATLWPRDARLEALASFSSWVAGEGDASWQRLVRAARPVDVPSYLELLDRAEDVLGATDEMPTKARDAIRSHVRRTADGMREFVARQDERGAIALADLGDLSAYCYVVAGIVGEMLTELFGGADRRVASVEGELAAHAAAFGEGLQLVNILKDAESDAREGRSYVPRGVARAEVVALARSDLARAWSYVRCLEAAGAREGIVAFCELPTRLAEATLDRLEEGATKLGRDEALRIFAELRDKARRRA